MTAFRNILATLLLLGMAVGCNSSMFKGEESKSNKDDDGRRPHEQGEGLVGYLKDPNDVQYERSNGEVVVVGKPNAVQVTRGKVGGLPLCLQQVTDAVLRGLLEAKAAFGGPGVTTLQRGKAAADGSFRLVVPEASIDPAQFISLNVTGQCGGQSQLSPSRHSILFKKLGDDRPFDDAAGYFPEFAEADGGDLMPETNEGFFCDTETKGCDAPVSFAVVEEISGKAFSEFFVDFYRSECDPKDPKSCEKYPIEGRTMQSDTVLYVPSGVYTFVISKEGYLSFEDTLDTANGPYPPEIKLIAGKDGASEDVPVDDGTASADGPDAGGTTD